MIFAASTCVLLPRSHSNTFLFCGASFIVLLGSTLMAILLHACFDSSGLAMVALFPSTPPYYLPIHYQTLGIAIVFSVAALVLIIVTRGDLGYHRYQRAVEAARGGTVR